VERCPCTSLNFEMRFGGSERISCISTLPLSLEKLRILASNRLQEFSGETLELFLSQAETASMNSGTGICESLNTGIIPKQESK